MRTCNTASFWRTALIMVPLLALVGGGWGFYQAERKAAKIRAGRQLDAVAHVAVKRLGQWRAATRSDAVLLAGSAQPDHFLAAHAYRLKADLGGFDGGHIEEMEADFIDSLAISTSTSWTRPTRTMEVLLVRRESGGGQEQVWPAAMVASGSLAAMAAAGRVGIVEGADDRGIESLAVIRPVPGTNSVVIVKDDAAEIFSLWRFRAALLTLGFAVLAMGGGGLAALVRHARQRTAKPGLCATEARLCHRLVDTRLHLREYAETHRLDELLPKALHETALLAGSSFVFLQTAGPERKTLAIRRTLSPQKNTGDRAVLPAEFETISDFEQHWPDFLHHERPTIGNRFAPEQGAISELCRQQVGDGRHILAPVLRNNTVVAVLGAAGRAASYRDEELDIIVQIAEDIWRLVEQKQVEEALLASERRYRTLYRSMMDAFVVIDPGGNIRECNEAYSNMLGYSIDELKRLNVVDITPTQWLAFENEHIKKQLVHQGSPLLYEKEYRRKDGTIFPVELHTFLIVDSEGTPEGMSAVVRDITERRLAQEERKRLREQLTQAQKMESVGQLAGGIAHDFNNMLSVILGYAEFASRKTAPSDPVQASLEEIVAAARRSTAIIRQLLTFARKQAIAPQTLDLNETMDGMLKMLQRLIGEHISLQWLPGRDLWPVFMDPSQVNQVLANLCVNARDAMKGQGGTITIETGQTTFDAAHCNVHAGFLPGDFVMLAVGDNGCGMEKGMLDKIFEPFFTTKAMGEGTGLGLATVYGIVRQNNGFINVRSEPGKGTTFRLYLPRAEGRPEEKAGPVESEQKPQRPGRKETVLVVEDDETILKLNQIMLEYLGYTVLAAASSEQALQMARRHAKEIRLLITDFVMPQMNGCELAREVRSLCPAAKVLYVSGYAAHEIARQYTLDKGSGFLEKPFASDELVQAIREVLAAQADAPPALASA
ncbi:MAG: PAS domain S-box protein [Desulfobulbus sp.]|jgi:PAS domain S-box-containing protein|uniref:PAS domain S-box protein n=1 Tax=Desulfobulbus sp. TaxID=895 RepID=UPI0028459A9B|nr:PAS domain S-box protein [Desulfobulbus sp.]MDR2551033.1 PAS domain S-box protein [Desulfobulbus sp.]